MRNSKKMLLAIGTFSFVLHLVTLYLVGGFVPLLDPTSYAIKSENYFNFFIPTEFLTSSLPSMTIGFYPPGFYLPYNIAFKLFGSHESVIRWVALLHQVVVPILAYMIVKKFAGTFITLIVSLMALFYSIKHVLYCPDNIVLPYSLLLIFCLLCYNENKKALYLYVCGAICGIITLTKHTIGVQYFFASLCAIVAMQIDFERKGEFENKKNIPVLLIVSLITIFYLFMLKNAFVLKDVIFFLLPVMVINILIFSLSRKKLLITSDLLKKLFAFCLPLGLIILIWLSVYSYYFRIEEYLYRLIFSGFAGFGRIYQDVLCQLSFNVVSIFTIFINLYLGTLKISDKWYYRLVVLFNVLIVFVFMFKIMINFNVGGVKQALIPNDMYFSAFLNFLAAGIFILKLQKNQLRNDDKIFFVLFVFSVFALNSIYPSNDLTHVKWRFAVNLLLLGYILFLIEKKTFSSRRVIYFTVVCLIFAFNLITAITPKINSIIKLYRDEISLYNDKIDIYLDKNIIEHFEKMKAALGDHDGQEALVVDSNSTQQIFYFIFNLKPVAPYFDYYKEFVEKEVSSDIIKRLEERKTRLVILSEDDYEGMATEHYNNVNLGPLYRYINENYYLFQFVDSTPELKKQQLIGCAIMVRKTI